MPRPAIHPGQILGDELKLIGVSPSDLARQIGVPSVLVIDIVNGTRRITSDIALRLGHQ